jgi:hypothetical protein
MQRRRLGLTQAFSLVRAAYLPMHTRIHTSQLSCLTIDRYVSILLRPGIDKSKIVDSLSVNICYTAKVADILPFLKFCAKAPRLEVQFRGLCSILQDRDKHSATLRNLNQLLPMKECDLS